MTTQPKLQLRSLQAGRGFAALLVVALHCSGYITDDPRYWMRTNFFTLLKGGQIGVEYFFVLSGAVILLAHWNDFGKPWTIPTYIQKRFRRIYPIYWLVLTVVVLEYALRPGLGAKYQTDPMVILSGYLLVHVRSLHVNLPVAWTLFHEILFYAIFAAILFRKTFGYITLTLWSIMSAALAVHPANDYLQQYLFAPIHLLFPLGMLVGWMLRKRLLKGSMVIFPAGLLLFGLAYVLCSRAPIESYAVQWTAGVGSALIILGAAGLELNGHLTIPKPLQFMGDASYSIYLVHYPFLMFLTPWLYTLSHHVALPLSIIVTAMIVSATLVGCITHTLIERPLLRCLNRARSKTMRHPA